MRSFLPKGALAAIGVLVITAEVRAADYYVALSGSDGARGTENAPFRSIAKGVSVASPGDTVFVRGGTYSGGPVVINKSGTAEAWLTISAYPGELPILDGMGAPGAGFSSAGAEYVRVVGIAVRNWGADGFANVPGPLVTSPSGHWQFVNCIAEGNGLGGIAFYNATDVLVDGCITAHNGGQPPSFSGGVFLDHVGGDAANNVVRRSVSFENIDVSPLHANGAGFVLDRGSTGVRFENNLGFRNGGACIRLTASSGAHLVNNTCYHDGLDPAAAMPPDPGEIYFSDAQAAVGLVFSNNLAAASGYSGAMTAFTGSVPLGNDNVGIDKSAPTPFFVEPGAADFHVADGAMNVIDRGTSTDAPETDIGFDAKCLKATPGAVSFWQFAIDYAYIATLGGISHCFHPGGRPVGTLPDVGAYEHGALPVDAQGSSGSNGTGSGGTGSGTTGSGVLAGTSSVGSSVGGHAGRAVAAGSAGASASGGSSRVDGTPGDGSVRSCAYRALGGSRDRGLATALALAFACAARRKRSARRAE